MKKAQLKALIGFLLCFFAFISQSATTQEELPKAIRFEKLSLEEMELRFSSKLHQYKDLESFVVADACPSTDHEWAEKQEALARFFSDYDFLRNVFTQAHYHQLFTNIASCMKKAENKLAIMDIQGCFSGFLEYLDFFEEVEEQNKKGEEYVKILQSDILAGEPTLKGSKNKEEELFTSIPSFLRNAEFFRALKTGDHNRLQSLFQLMRKTFLKDQDSSVSAGEEYFHSIDGGFVEAIQASLDASGSDKRFLVVVKSRYSPREGERAREIQRNISFTLSSGDHFNGYVDAVSNYVEVRDALENSSHPPLPVRYYGSDWNFFLNYSDLLEKPEEHRGFCLDCHEMSSFEALRKAKSSTYYSLGSMLEADIKRVGGGEGCYHCHRQGTLSFKSPTEDKKYYRFADWFNKGVEDNEAGVQFHQNSFSKKWFINNGYFLKRIKEVESSLGAPLLSGVPYEYRKKDGSLHKSQLRCAECHVSFPEEGQRDVLMVHAQDFLIDRVKTGHGLRSTDPDEILSEFEGVRKALVLYENSDIDSATDGKVALGSLYKRLMNSSACQEYKKTSKKSDSPERSESLNSTEELPGDNKH